MECRELMNIPESAIEPFGVIGIPTLTYTGMVDVDMIDRELRLLVARSDMLLVPKKVMLALLDLRARTFGALNVHALYHPTAVLKKTDLVTNKTSSVEFKEHFEVNFKMPNSDDWFVSNIPLL